MRLPMLAAALVFVISGCATNPVTGESELSLVSESQEISMGKSYSAQVRQTIGDYPDSNVQRYVNELGQSIAAKTERAQLKWEFHVIDDPAVNAFALPGGFIFVTRGLMTHLNSDAELATVLGHEAGHVAAKHSVKQVSQQELMLLGLGVGAALSPDVRKYAGEISAGMGLLFLKFSRDDESQADQLGFRYALADGYDSRQMVNVFQMLDAIDHEGDGGHLPEWQSTHPNPGSRIKNTEQLIAKSTQDFNDEKLGKANYLHLVDGMTFGEDPRQGYFAAGLFMHPDLQFQFHFPDGWKTDNGAEAVTSASANGDALIELRIVPGSVNQAAQSFFSREGLVSDGSQPTSVHGNPGVVASFHAQTTSSAVQGVVLFVAYRGATYQVMAMATPQSYAGYQTLFVRALQSFDALTDPKALAMKPNHIHLERVPNAMTLEAFNRQFPSVVPLKEIAIINGLAANAALQRGQLVKRVVAQ